MTKKAKTKVKKKPAQEGNETLKKLNRVDLLELLLEQTKRVEELEGQLAQAKLELEEKDIKLREVVKLARQAMDLVDKEADRRAEAKVKKFMAENKKAAPAIKPAAKPTTAVTANSAMMPAAKPATAPAQRINFFDAAGQVDVAKILSRK